MALILFCFQCPSATRGSINLLDDHCVPSSALKRSSHKAAFMAHQSKSGMWMRMLEVRWSILGVIGVMLAHDLSQVEAQSGVAHATFYGGADARGTNDGACGYANVFSLGYGTMTTALSAPLFNAGVSCGACFELKCVDSPACYPGNPSLIVTATNLCPQGSNGGWCDSPKQHFDLAQPAFASIAQTRDGWFPLQYKRVSCVRKGGVKFTVQGHAFFNLVLIYNVGGDGDVIGVKIKGSNGSWRPMQRNWGQNWADMSDMTGQTLSFLITTSNSAILLANNVAPSSWRFGQTFEGPNF